MASDFISDTADARVSETTLRFADCVNDASTNAGARVPAGYGDFVAPIVNRFNDKISAGDRDIILFSPWSATGNMPDNASTRACAVDAVTAVGDHLKENPFAQAGHPQAVAPGNGWTDMPITSSQVVRGSSEPDAEMVEHQAPVPLIEPGPGTLLTRAEKEQILSCFHPRTNMNEQFRDGAFFGAAMGAGAWALDSRYRSLSPDDRLKYMRWWEPLSPMLRKQGELNKTIADIAAKNKEIAATVADYEPRLNEASKAVHDLHKKIDTSIENGTNRDEWIAAFKRQSSFIEHDLPAASKKVIGQTFGTQEQVLKGEKLFESKSDLAKELFSYRSESWKKNIEEAEALRTKMLKQVNLQIEDRAKYPPLTPDELAALEKRREFLSNLENLRSSERINNVLGTADDVKAGRKLFVVGSDEQKLLTDHAKWYDLRKSWSEKLTLSEKALAGAQGKLTAQLEGGAGSLFERAGKGAGRGLMATGISMGAYYAIDKNFNKDAQIDAARLIADGALMPAVLLSEMPMRFKIGAALAVQGLSHIGDFCNKDAGVANLSQTMRPNWVDSFGSTVVGTLPLGFGARCLGAAAVLASGRIYNGVARAYNWDGAGIAALNGEADEAFAKDLSTKTVESFKHAVQKEKEVALVSDEAMRLKWEQWWEKGSALNAPDYMRGTAALFAARGEARLEQGSRLNNQDHFVEPNLVLKSQKYDFGGEATADLRRAAMELVNARNYISKHPGADAAGQAEYLNQLKDLQQSVELKLDAVYGAHDMDAVLQELQKADFVGLLQSIARLRDQIGVSNNHDPRHVAKLARDLAIGELALGSKPNADSSYCDDAMRYMAISQKYDPAAPDNRSLQIIAARLQLARKQ